MFISQVFYSAGVTLAKISIIATYLRFIRAKSFHYAMYVVGFIVIGNGVTNVFVTIFECRPIHAVWDFTMASRNCINMILYLYVSAGLTIATDVALCVCPWPYLWRLHMPRKQRAILCGLLGLGSG